MAEPLFKLGGDEKMDEELMDLVTEETIEVTGAEIIKTEVTIEDEEYDVSTEEVVEAVEVIPAETIEIEMDEAIGWVGGNSERHYSLQGRNDPDQHEIEAITGLRAELDEIERLKTVYSDEKGVADYYKWEDKNPLAENRIGYFVSLCKDVRTIKRCTGEDIFGITVDNSAFVGGQDNIARDYKYGLVACSGVAKVRCELDVQVGDYVVSNGDGVAQKTDSGYGCKVIAIHEITEPEEISLHGVRHAVVSLDLSINQIDKMAKEADKLAERVSVNEVNIVSAINVANQAYQSSSETKEFTQNQIDDIADKVIEAIGKSDSALELSKGAENSASQAQLIAVQAQSLANSAALSAQDMKDEAVKTANDAWKGINDLTETLKPITEWEDPDNSENTGAQFFTEYMVDGLKTKVDIETFETKTEEGFSTIQRNAREVRSLIVDIDKYSVGEYSQANGLTLEQAQSILEVGMIYVPTSHENLDAHPEYHKEEYVYEVNGETKTYVRWFTPGYLYRWDKIPNKEIGVGWLTIGNNTETNNPEVATREENYSASQITPNVSPWVFFSDREPKINNIWNYGYWFTNGDSIVDVYGNPSTYEPYTLYKWEKSEDEDGYWFAVATLAGNSSNRATSMIRQTANEIAAELTNAYGAVASSGVYMKDTHTKVQSIASWPTTKGFHRLATIEQSASGDDSHLVLAAGAKEDGSPNLLSGATIVLNDSTKGSYIQMDADHINFTANDYTVLANNIRLDADQINFTAGDLGGRNLLLNSKFSNSSASKDGIYTFEGNEIIFESSNMVNGYLEEDQEITCYRMSLSPYAISNIRNKNLTISIDYCAETEIEYGTVRPWAGAQLSVRYEDKDSEYLNWYGGTSFPRNKTNGWKRYGQMVKIQDREVTGIQFSIWFRCAKGKVKFRYPKIEIGNIGTDWTIAPEEQMSSQGVISSINMSPEDITINANKLNLDGYVTISSLANDGTTEIDGSRITTGAIESKNYVENTSGSSLNLEDGSFDSKYFKVSNEGKMTAMLGDIAGWDITSRSIEKSITTTEDGQSVTYKAYMQTPDVEAPSLNTSAFAVMRTVNGGGSTWPFKISYDGAITVQRGIMAGWTIDGNIFSKETSGIYTGNIGGQSLINKQMSPVRFFAGGTIKEGDVEVDYKPDFGAEDDYIECQLPPDNLLKVVSVNVTVDSSVGDKDSVIKSVNFDNSGLVSITLKGSIDALYTLFIHYKYISNETNFQVLEDGSLYARAAEISTESQEGYGVQIKGSSVNFIDEEHGNGIPINGFSGAYEADAWDVPSGEPISYSPVISANTLFYVKNGMVCRKSVSIQCDCKFHVFDNAVSGSGKTCQICIIGTNSGVRCYLAFIKGVLVYTGNYPLDGYEIIEYTI